MKTPFEIYLAEVKSGKLKANPAQAKMMQALDDLYKRLVKQKGWFATLKRKSCRQFQLACPLVKGIYLWGGVGRGKTFIMDLFYHALPFPEKQRFHFHRFMQYIHDALHQYNGNKDPLKEVAKDLASKNLVICFDEFYVEDIADAMILGELFKHLFRQGVSLVATSNSAPEDLYLNGLQRDKFLPAIRLIHASVQVLTLDHPEDYRMQFLQHHKLYHYPLDDASDGMMKETFSQLAGENTLLQKPLTVMNRSIQTLAVAETVVWFSFESLCMTMRSSRDYIEIARNFHVVLLSGVKKMGSQNEAAARRFMALVDEFYDRQVTLVLSAEVPINELYEGARYQKEFQRIISRLTQMQSTEYLAKPHKG